MRSIRIVLAAFWLTLALLALAAVNAHGVRAAEPALSAASAATADTTIPVLVHPPQPCAGQAVTLLALVPNCGPCEHVVAVDAQNLRIDVAWQPDCRTLVACTLDTVPLPLGPMVAGNYQAVVTFRFFVYSGDTLVDTTETQTHVAWTVTATCDSTPGTLPYVSHVVIGNTPPPCPTCPPVVCANRRIPVHVDGVFPNECWAVRRVELIPSMLTVIGPPTLRILVDDHSCYGMACAEVPTPWAVDTVLAGLPYGDYRLPVQIARVSCSDSFPPESLFTAVFPFRAADNCPPGELLPYIDRVAIGSSPCAGCPPVVCSGQPYPVLLSGLLPDNCVQFLGVEVLDLRMSPMPSPPIVRAKFAVNDCLAIPCIVGPIPWMATVLLPGLPEGSYTLPVQSQQVSMCDTTRQVALDGIALPFHVDSCPGVPPPPPLCFNYSWTDDRLYRPCDGYFAGDSSSADLRIASPVALAGLQGVLHVDPGMVITGLEPIGSAVGMNLQWIYVPGGARFVMFAPSGAPIPPYNDPGNDTAYVFRPVLRVHVQLTPITFRDPTPTVMKLWADSLLASDIDGRGVEPCPIPCPAVFGQPCGPAFRFCIPLSCDVNGDGRDDVRDLVVMVHCILGGGPCPDTTMSLYDCNGSRHADLDDVICCATAMLQGAPPSTNPPPATGISLRFGEPRREGDELIVPLAIDGASGLGAARLVFGFPSDRYASGQLMAPGAPAEWLVISETRGAELVGGVVGLSESPGATLPLELHLWLRAGAEHGGTVGLESSELTARDGAQVGTLDIPPGVAIDPNAPVALSAVQPNPSVGSTRFTLTLPRAMDVDLAVHDLAGRRVASLYHGPMMAGVRVFVWNGATDGGATARDGVYFIRVRAGGMEVARKAVLMRGR